MIFWSPTAGLRRRSIFYGQLSTLLRAAIPLSQILGRMAASPPDPASGRVAQRLLDQIDHQATWAEAFQSVRGWAPPFDLALIDAGERSGRLDEAFDTLARHHRRRAENLRRVVQSAAYPLFVLHVAAFVIPLPALVAGGTFAGYLLKSVGVLVSTYSLVGAVVWALSGQRNEGWRSLVERLVLRVPLLGAARSALALGRLAGSLESLITAGVLVTEAWPLAARASGSPLLTRVVARWPPLLDGGQTPAELVAESGPFPDTFVSSYATGEIAGQLDEQLRWLAKHYEEEGFEKLHQLAVVVPVLGYGLVAGWIVLYIFSMFLNYMTIINDLLGP